LSELKNKLKISEKYKFEEILNKLKFNIILTGFWLESPKTKNV
jgi:hypothetical protein